MADTKRLSADIIESIYKLHGEGLSPRAIAKQLGVGHTSVRRYLAAGPASGAGQQPTHKSTSAAAPTARAALTTTLADAVVVAISPRRFEMSSILLWQAMEVTRREWGWPELSPSDWLDTFLWYAFKQRGIILGAYQVVRKSGENHQEA